MHQFNRMPIQFGSGENSFDIEFVKIGDAGNVADTTGEPNPAGAVDYVYNIGKFEISRDAVEKANAQGGLGRFPAAYKFSTQPGEAGYDAHANIEIWAAGDEGFDAANPFRNSQARYFLPSTNEWYKAAYYDPAANGGAGGYWDFPFGSDAGPMPVASGTEPDTAVHLQPYEQGPADIPHAGGLSPYGVMGLGGNVFEWLESELGLVNEDGFSVRVFRGNAWPDLPIMSSRNRNGGDPWIEDDYIGFRVASIPEPSSLRLGTWGVVGLLMWRRRTRRRFIPTFCRKTAFTQLFQKSWEARFDSPDTLKNDRISTSSPPSDEIGSPTGPQGLKMAPHR